ncbi:MAG: tRNA (adenosine(37)-N6)-threonylcarbamoyltransferase complex dimerization subunit type 1 TsaB [Clostridiales bacterium]|nr:tRNA (adenosine(37)-N6)-threonylcarbamoyltransferase complex dimerization subunit type 1 TsaB [Clostridiales bacterium]
MKILALESSGLVAGIAVLEDENLLGEYTINYKKTHSQTLLPMLDEVAKMIELDLNSVDAIAVSAGPGSFTGLRIGSATAKGLGLALDKPLIHVPTVDALACNLWGCADLICPIMDARRNQTYTGVYRFADGQLEIVKEQCAVGIDEIVEEINCLGQPVVFLGDGVAVFSSYIKENCRVPFSFAPAHMNKQRAGSVAYLGLQYAREGRIETAAEHKPDYLRLSQAERERKQRAMQIRSEAE